MIRLHTGIVLRAPSLDKSIAVILDEHQGKIEGIIYQRKGFSRPFHGALMSYSLRKKGMRYVLDGINLLDMPLYWAQENLLFFHHVLELCHYFVQWDMESIEIFRLMKLLYTVPSLLATKKAQKTFLHHFFKKLGLYPKFTGGPIEEWLEACIHTHPQAPLLQTRNYFKLLEQV